MLKVGPIREGENDKKNYKTQTKYLGSKSGEEMQYILMVLFNQFRVPSTYNVLNKC